MIVMCIMIHSQTSGSVVMILNPELSFSKIALLFLVMMTVIITITIVVVVAVVVIANAYVE